MYMWVNITCVSVPMDARRVCCVPWSCCYRKLVVSHPPQVLRYKLRSHGRAICALNHWGNSFQPPPGLYFILLNSSHCSLLSCGSSLSGPLRQLSFCFHDIHTPLNSLAPSPFYKPLSTFILWMSSTLGIVKEPDFLPLDLQLSSPF